jgi:hypothetical protein
MKFPPIGVVPEPSATRFLRFVERLLHCPPIGDLGGRDGDVSLRSLTWPHIPRKFTR